MNYSTQKNERAAKLYGKPCIERKGSDVKVGDHVVVLQKFQTEAVAREVVGITRRGRTGHFEIWYRDEVMGRMFTRVAATGKALVAVPFLAE